MYNLISERERKLQKKLIPLNIVVCIISLVAAITMFLTPIIKVDVGKILRDEGMIEFVEEKIDGALDKDLSNNEHDEVNYKPVLTKLVTNILSKGKGEISISAISAFRVLTASDNDKAAKVLDELLFGKNALATNLINSVVDGIANLFSTDKGREVLEEAILSTLTNQMIGSVENQEIIDAFNKHSKELIEIFKEIDNADDNGAAVAGKFIDKLDEYLGEDSQISPEDKQAFIDRVTEMYSNTQDNLGDGERVTFENIICVTVSDNLDLSKANLGNLFDGLFSKGEEESEDEESGLNIKTVDEELDGSESENGNTVVTNYDDLLAEMGYDKDAKDNLKEKMRTTLDNELSKLVEEKGIDNYLKYYQYVFFGILPFMVLWLILFLFSLFHMVAQNKRFTMWYVKLFCWIPAIIWLVLVLIPRLATKISFVNDFWNGDNGNVVRAVFGGISSLTWISGLCYVLLWLVSIFWAFPIKHKIRKERKNPEVIDAEDDEIEF